MPNNYLQGVAVATSIIALGILVYIKLLKKKMKKFILRSEKIEKYFERD
jgi:hypothetical protein